MKYFARIEQKLIKHFKPTKLEIIDESNRHSTHSGSRPGGETHFKINMTSSLFKGKTKIDQQREVYRVLKDEIKERIHALSLELYEK
tara:strand:+ start:1581 stop:1841 length:261 start_codon:yes stop_codon:yes gene_type:complete